MQNDKSSSEIHWEFSGKVHSMLCCVVKYTKNKLITITHEILGNFLCNSELFN